MTRSMRSELAPNFSRRSLAIWALSFSIVSCVTIRPFLAAASSLLRASNSASFAINQPLQLGDVVGQLVGRERHAPDLSASAARQQKSRGRSPQIIPPASAATSVAAPATPALRAASTTAPASA